MVSSSESTPEAYLASLPPKRRETLSAVREVILQSLPAGYEEAMNWGMICYEIPLSRYPDTYNKQPLMYAALAAQKRHNAVYLTNVYQDPGLEAAFRGAFENAGKRLDMGKSCVRFRNLDDLVLEAVADVIASTPPDEYIRWYEAARRK